MLAAAPLPPAPPPAPPVLAAAAPVAPPAPAAPPAAPPPAAPAPEKPRAAKSDWAERAAKAGGVRVVVSLPQQRAYVFKGGELAFTAPVSTGKRGHETPAGTFRITQKKVKHRSNRYANAPMPYMQRLTDYGIAIHAGALPGYPASHGCIRLPRSLAKKLYGMTSYGTRVTITRKRFKSAKDALRIA